MRLSCSLGMSAAKINAVKYAFRAVAFGRGSESFDFGTNEMYYNS